MEITPRKQLISEKLLLISEIKDNPKSIEIYGKNENVDDLIKLMNEVGFDFEYPILLNHKYEIISGHRRVHAALQIGLKEVPVKIYKYLNELDELEDLLNANTQRIKSSLATIRERNVRERIHNERLKLNQIAAGGDKKSIEYQLSLMSIIDTSGKTKELTSRKQTAIEYGISEGKHVNEKNLVITIDNLNNKNEKAGVILEKIAEKFKTVNTAVNIKNEIEKSGIDINLVLKQPNVEKIISNEKTTPKDIRKEVDITITSLKKEQLSKDINIHFKDSKLSSEELKEIQDNINRGIFKTKEQVIESVNTKNIKTIPEKFDVVVIDPPWPYGTEYDEETRRIGSPYPEMSLEEITNIDIPAKDDCVLWLWTTHKFMRESFKILDKWGFTDKVILTWVKNRMGMGSWLRSKSEFCIMAIKGNPIITLTNQTTILNADVREHSRKPDEFYKMVDSLCVGIKLDYFSREKRDGWYQYGNETNKF